MDVCTHTHLGMGPHAFSPGTWEAETSLVCEANLIYIPNSSPTMATKWDLPSNKKPKHTEGVYECVILMLSNLEFLWNNFERLFWCCFCFIAKQYISKSKWAKGSICEDTRIQRNRESQKNNLRHVFSKTDKYIKWCRRLESVKTFHVAHTLLQK